MRKTADSQVTVNMAMNIIDPQDGVPTAHVKRTLDFYVGRLLFDKIAQSKESCTVAFGGDRVTFRKAHRDEVRSLRDLGFGLSFRITNIHDYFHRLKTPGMIEFRQELELMQPGVWQFSVVDPNGFAVGFAMSVHRKAA